MLTKLAGVASLSNPLMNTALLYRLLEEVTVIMALALLSTMMVGILILIGFYAIYLGLCYCGMSSGFAFLSVITLALFMTIALIGVVFYKLKLLRSCPRQSLASKFPPLAKATAIAQAFIKGFHETTP